MYVKPNKNRPITGGLCGFRWWTEGDHTRTIYSAYGGVKIYGVVGYLDIECVVVSCSAEYQLQAIIIQISGDQEGVEQVCLIIFIVYVALLEAVEPVKHLLFGDDWERRFLQLDLAR